MYLETERLFLRPWKKEDAKALYELAKDPKIGPAAGWEPHGSVEESETIIETILSDPETYAVFLKEENTLIGCVGLMIGSKSNLDLMEKEGEIGYWIGSAYWNHGYCQEAVLRLIEHARLDLNLEEIWCAYFAENERSKAVQTKCGFQYHHTLKRYWETLKEDKIEHVTKLKRSV